MAFIRKEEKKGISLPGLIDIIFLLLIFSLATLTFSDSDAQKEQGGEGAFELELPQTRAAETFKSDEVLGTLLFQIEHIDREDPASLKTVYVLWPSWEDSLTVSEAKENAVNDSLFARFPENFLQLDDREFRRIEACRLIDRSLDEYKNTHFLEPNFANTVEVRAVRDTEFRIINYIMERCSAYGDTIPRFTLRTLSGTGEEGGF